MKLVRKQMINGQRPSICNNCWKQEDYNMISARQQVNSVYAKYLGLVEQTSSDGSFTNFKLRSFDFRTSNVCNLKCRMCGGKYSSRIAQEEIDLYPSMHTDRNFVELKLNSAEIQNVLDFFKPK
jgi:transcription elongation factor Elf1